MSFRRSILLGSYRGLKSQVVEDFGPKFAFFEKSDPIRVNFQNFVPKGLIATLLVCKFREICPTGSWRNCALLTSQKFFPRSISLASAWIAPKICQDQQQTMYSGCPKFHPNW